MRRIILLYCAKLLYRVVFYHAATIFNRFRQFYSFEERRNLRRTDGRTNGGIYLRTKKNVPAAEQTCHRMHGDARTLRKTFRLRAKVEGGRVDASRHGRDIPVFVNFPRYIFGFRIIYSWTICIRNCVTARARDCEFA